MLKIIMCGSSAHCADRKEKENLKFILGLIVGVILVFGRLLLLCVWQRARRDDRQHDAF